MGNLFAVQQELIIWYHFVEPSGWRSVLGFNWINQRIFTACNL